MKYTRLLLLLSAATVLLSCPLTSYSAYPVSVVSSAPVTTQILPEMAVIEATLAEILAAQIATGTAITQNAEKMQSIVTQSSEATRQQMIFNNETQRLEEARKTFTVPDSICSESASGVAAQSRQSSRKAAAKLSSGGGVSNTGVRNRVKNAPESRARDAYDGSAIHATYCTEAEYERYGGTDACPSINNELPGGDSQVRSIYDGAGTQDDPPTLTWDQKQVDAAMAYTKNTSRPSAGRTPGKGEVSTLTGRTYLGLQTEYNGIIDAASEPLLSLTADSTPNETTKTALQEAIQSPSAEKYFTETASETAQSKGYMSTREFEAFEAGRRYANTAYLTDLQDMDSDNLLRELVRTTAQINWQLNDLKEQLRKGNVLAGQQLALSARQYYEQRLAGLESAMNQGISK
ncbi:conjugal transfer protein TraW [Salmonella enterica subsp. enterica]|nr:conjugal transfer protein TraW [Salmonella enterica subsp. enterica]